MWELKSIGSARLAPHRGLGAAPLMISATIGAVIGGWCTCSAVAGSRCVKAFYHASGIGRRRCEYWSGNAHSARVAACVSRYVARAI